MIIGVYTRLIAAFDPADELFLDSQFSRHSDAINALINKPPGQLTFPTKESFLAAQAVNPPLPIIIDAVEVAGYHKLVMTWTATFGTVRVPIKGITILTAMRNPGNVWKIQRLDVELNGLAWVINAGGNITYAGRTMEMSGAVGT